MVTSSIIQHGSTLVRDCSKKLIVKINIFSKHKWKILDSENFLTIDGCSHGFTSCVKMLGRPEKKKLKKKEDDEKF